MGSRSQEWKCIELNFNPARVGQIRGVKECEGNEGSGPVVLVGSSRARMLQLNPGLHILRVSYNLRYEVGYLNVIFDAYDYITPWYFDWKKDV